MVAFCSTTLISGEKTRRRSLGEVVVRFLRNGYVSLRNKIRLSRRQNREAVGLVAHRRRKKHTSFFESEFNDDEMSRIVYCLGKNNWGEGITVSKSVYRWDNFIYVKIPGCFTLATTKKN